MLTMNSVFYVQQFFVENKINLHDYLEITQQLLPSKEVIVPILSNLNHMPVQLDLMKNHCTKMPKCKNTGRQNDTIYLHSAFSDQPGLRL